MKNKIKILREKLGLTQEQLGRLVGTSRQAINAIETGKMNLQYGWHMIFQEFLMNQLKVYFYLKKVKENQEHR